MLALRRDQIQKVLETLNKMAEYYRVSGLKLNLKKCEILTINCNNDDIATLLQCTGIKQVNTLKHLGYILIIKEIFHMTRTSNQSWQS